MLLPPVRPDGVLGDVATVVVADLLFVMRL